MLSSHSLTWFLAGISDSWLTLEHFRKHRERERVSGARRSCRAGSRGVCWATPIFTPKATSSGLISWSHRKRFRGDRNVGMCEPRAVPAPFVSSSQAQKKAGPALCGGKNNTLYWRSLGLDLTDFEGNKICTIDSMANENLWWTLRAFEI